MPNTDLGGWEVAYAIRYDDINRHIATDIAAHPGVFPSSVSLTAAGTQQLGITGSVAPWRLVPGGTGRTVVIGITLTNVSIDGGATDHDGGTVGITLRSNLTIDSKGSVRVDTQNLVSDDITFDFMTTLNLIEKLGAQSALRQWVGGLSAAFSTELTAIENGVQPSGPAWQWIMPRTASVVVSEYTDPANDALVLVAMASQAPAPIATPTLQNVFVPPGAAVGYFIDPGLFLANVIQPSIHQLFDGADPSSFVTSGARITATTALAYEKFKVGNEGPVKAVISAFSLEVDNNQLNVQMTLAFPYQNATVTSTFVASMELCLDDNGLITTKNTYVKSPETVIDVGSSLATASWLAPLIVGIVTAVASGLAAVGSRTADPTATTNAGDTQTELSSVTAPEPAPAPSTDDADEAIATVNGSSEQAGGAAVRSFARTAPVWQVFLGSALLGGLAGAVPTVVTQIMTDTSKGGAAKYADLFDQFMLNAIKPVTLPDHIASKADIKMTSIELNGAVVIGAGAA